MGNICQRPQETPEKPLVLQNRPEHKKDSPDASPVNSPKQAPKPVPKKVEPPKKKPESSITDMFKPTKLYKDTSVAYGMKDFLTLKHVDDIHEHYNVRDKKFNKPEGDNQTFHIKHIRLNEMFAVKKLKKMNEGVGNDLIMKELDTLQKIADHPHIIEVKEILHDDKYFYVATEICEGGDLLNRMSEEKDGKFNDKQAGAIAEQILEAVNYMHHREFYHKSLKASNILLDSTDLDHINIKVSEFGFAAIAEANTKPSFLNMKPLDLGFGDKENAEIDVKSIGEIMFLLLTGEKYAQGAAAPKPAGKLKPGKKPSAYSGDVEKRRLAESICNGLSDKAKDFLLKCLKKELGCKELLGHEWIKEHERKVLTDKQRLEIVLNLKRYANMDKFVRCILNLLVGLVDNKKMMQDVQLSFAELDKQNKSGILTEESFKIYSAQIKKAGLQDQFDVVVDKIDLDKNKQISYLEFVTAACNHKQVAQNFNIKKAFSLFDKDGSGNIDIKEFRFALPSAPKKFEGDSSDLIESAQKQSKEMFKNKDDPAQQKWQQTINALDKDGDGEVSLDEFANAINKFITDAYKHAK